jgi:hypothetical protein
MFVSKYSNTTGATSGTGTAYTSGEPNFNGASVAEFVYFWSIMERKFRGGFFFLFFFWSMYYPSFFTLMLLSELSVFSIYFLFSYFTKDIFDTSCNKSISSYVDFSNQFRF